VAHIDLSPYLPVNDTVSDATTIAAALTTIETLVNGALDLTNMTAGVVGLSKIGEVHLGSGAASMSLSSIPATYTHLLLMLTARGDTAAAEVTAQITFNGDSGANYDVHSDYASDTTPSASKAEGATSFGLTINGSTANANAPGVVVMFIPDYVGTTFHKIALCLFGHMYAEDGSGNRTGTTQGRWRNTAAITTIAATASAGNFVTGSRLSLYGLA
jgi:hypothetical protein